VPQALDVAFKPLLLNVTQGYFINILRVRASGVLSRNRHYGPVHAFTLRGTWRYLEHDWVASAGDYAFEPPGETHSLVVPDDVQETATLFHVTGGDAYIDPYGVVLGYEDVFTKLKRQAAITDRSASERTSQKTDPMTTRAATDVDDIPISYLTGGERGPLVLLLHGTYWSRVWQPVLDDIASAGLYVVAVDFPGFGRSGGELEVAAASIPQLAAWLVRFLDAIGHKGPVMVAGHDIGGGVAQYLLIKGAVEVSRLALVNAVLYDSWPVSGVARFRDPAVAAATSTEDVLAARRQSVVKALARPASEAEIAEYLEPWTIPRVARSWLALAGAADNRYTLELLPALRKSTTPKLLVWGEDDEFQRVEHAERFAAEIPATRLIRIPRAGHIPMENEPATVGRVLGDFFAAH
jgi:pimeloyl-ACP methyl ester carboxylesterase